MAKTQNVSPFLLNSTAPWWQNQKMTKLVSAAWVKVPLCQVSAKSVNFKSNFIGKNWRTEAIPPATWGSLRDPWRGGLRPKGGSLRDPSSLPELPWKKGTTLLRSVVKKIELILPLKLLVHELLILTLRLKIWKATIDIAMTKIFHYCSCLLYGHFEA